MGKVNDFCVTENYTIKEVMDTLERIRERGVIVVNETGKVCGVLSQGDIIKALAQGRGMFSRITSIYSTSFMFLNERNMEKAFEIFKRKNLCLIPIIDKDYHLEDVLTSRDLLRYASFEKEAK